VEDAALLADIGRVVLSGATLSTGGGVTTTDLAQWSAAIIAEAPTLLSVSALVAESHRPYRRPGEARDLSLPVAAQVVKVATAYDYAVGGGMEPGDALEVLHRGVAYDYDPEVLAALRRVLLRRGYLGG
jgi:HD-GYP domain-containing protein (c-di-GMP phosphodiesterase class II)